MEESRKKLKNTQLSAPNNIFHVYRRGTHSNALPKFSYHRVLKIARSPPDAVISVFKLSTPLEALKCPPAPSFENFASGTSLLYQYSCFHVANSCEIIPCFIEFRTLFQGCARATCWTSARINLVCRTPEARGDFGSLRRQTC